MLPGSELTAASILIAGISTILFRFSSPIPTECDRADSQAPHLNSANLLGVFAILNWIGYLLHCNASPIEALPVVFILGGSQCWLHGNTLRQFVRWSASHSVGYESNLAPLESQSADSDAEDLIDRKTVDGIADDGRRCLSGEIHVRFESGQRKLEVVVGFCPPFPAEPDVDFELEHESLSARLVRCTPTGMRMEVRREPSGPQLNSVLHWYALAIDVPLDSEPALGPERGLTAMP